MHELSIAMAIAKTVLSTAEEYQVTKIAKVTIEVGEIADILPGYLKSCWPAATHDTILKDTELEIIMVNGMIQCPKCGKIYRFLEHSHGCPECGSTRKQVLSGRGLNIKDIVAC